MDLFGDTDQQFRALGWWQPFGSLMLPPYLKIETREINGNRKPGFPLGKYLIYTTKKRTPEHLLLDWCGEEIYSDIIDKLRDEETAKLDGYAIGIGHLTEIRRMRIEDERRCFVKYKPNKYCLIFADIKRIQPFKWNHGKQGPGFVPEAELSNIRLI